jgi:hypothetical protein
LLQNGAPFAGLALGPPGPRWQSSSEVVRKARKGETAGGIQAAARRDEQGAVVRSAERHVRGPLRHAQHAVQPPGRVEDLHAGQGGDIKVAGRIDGRPVSAREEGNPRRSQPAETPARAKVAGSQYRVGHHVALEGGDDVQGPLVGGKGDPVGAAQVVDEPGHVPVRGQVVDGRHSLRREGARRVQKRIGEVDAAGRVEDQVIGGVVAAPAVRPGEHAGAGPVRQEGRHPPVNLAGDDLTRRADLEPVGPARVGDHEVQPAACVQPVDPARPVPVVGEVEVAILVRSRALGVDEAAGNQPHLRGGSGSR